MPRWLKELAEQYGLVWFTLKWMVGVLMLLFVGLFCAPLFQPRPAVVIDVENRTSDSLLNGRLTINYRDADELGVIPPDSKVRFVANVPHEQAVGAKFSRRRAADVEAFIGGYFQRGDTVHVQLVAAGDSLVRRPHAASASDTVAEAVAARSRAIADSAAAIPRNPKQRK